jgi:hypothetical protein
MGAVGEAAKAGSRTPARHLVSRRAENEAGRDQGAPPGG